MIIGIDLGGMSAKAACMSSGNLFGKTRIETSAKKPAEETAHALAALCIASAEASGISFDEVEGIGIGSPGVVDSERGIVAKWTNFGWKDVPLGDLLSKYTGKRVFMTNDANAAALGEAKYGAGRQYQDSIFVTLGTGVGGGIIFGGTLFEGYRSAGAEIGHMVIRQNGKRCSCGRRGCFEMYASTRALIARTKKEMMGSPESGLHEIAKCGGGVDGTTVFTALKRGDDSARRVFADYIASLGEGIVNLVNIFRPQAVLIGGGISAEGEALLAPLKKYVYERIYVSEDYAPLDIVTASLKNDAGLYGAAEYARSRLG